ncbi:MAG: 3-dehydroquinate synthase [Hyphomonadaceae bacterium]|nr:3-dehydroquinate synthase [Hyphomonadaceae bacterium]
MITLPVASREGGYDVVIGAGVLHQLGALMQKAGVRGRVAVISDETVFGLWGDKARAAIEAAGYEVVATLRVPPGEESKTLASAEQLYDGLLEAGIGRRDAIVALGGGVVGDLAGFVAATLHRGVSFVQVPTTLLSQVDSSVGGKVAVDHRLGKNLIGAFYPPRLVVADTNVLQTLPARERWSGMAEIVKAAFIRDAKLLADLEQQIEALMEPANDALPDIIARAVAVKAGVVARDEHETGERMLLNLGHTFGHAIETVAGYGALTHGEAVTHGMRVAVALSERRGKLDAASAQRAQALLARFPSPAWPKLEPDALVQALWRDKKVAAGKVKFILLDRLGNGVIDDGLSADDLAYGAQIAAAAP